MRYTKHKSFIGWASRSLIGHVALFQIVWTPVMLVVFSDGLSIAAATSLGKVIYVVFLTVVSGVIVALLVWYTITRRLITKRDVEVSGNKE